MADITSVRWWEEGEKMVYRRQNEIAIGVRTEKKYNRRIQFFFKLFIFLRLWRIESL